jgi:uncharacterized protein (TIGR02284 family)
MDAESLKTLHTSLVDNRKGYVEAAKDAETPMLRSLFSDMIALKENDHSELHAALRKLGEAPDDSGSFMATVHETIIKARGATTGLGSALSSFVMGENAVVKQYNDVMLDCASDPAIVAMLNKQKAALLGKIATMESIDQ